MRGIEAAIVVAGASDLPGWTALRALLWPGDTAAEHVAEAAAVLARPEDRVAFVAVARGTVLGFAEASMRCDAVNGCETSPVAFLEGLYIDERHRRGGLARGLCAAVEDWARALGLTELGSDAEALNADGLAFHGGVGFTETERVIFFRKPL